MTYQYIQDKNSSELRRLAYTYILMTYTLTVMYSLWSREIYGFLISNEEIAATYKYSIILVMALCYRPLYCYSCTYFFYHEHTVQLLGITFVSGVISCVFYFTMIPYFGIYAALVGFYIGCLYLGYSGYFYRFYKQKSICSIRWYLFLFAQLMMTGCVFYCVDFPILNKLLITTLFMVVVGFLFIKKVRGNVYKIS